MKAMKRFALLGLVGWFCLTMSAIAQQRWAAELAEPLDYVPGEVLVKFRPGTPPGLMHQALQHLSARHVKTFPKINVHHWRTGRGITTESALAILSRPPFRDFVEYAEPNYIYHAYQQGYPNDPLRGDQWSLHNIGQTGGKTGSDMHALETWGYQNGAAPIVAVIDTGVEYTHPDLAANMWTGKDDNGNSVHGWDYVNNDNDPMDDNGHGTHVSGTIGAVSNNGAGVVGVSWRVQIMAVKFLNSGGSGSTTAAISSIQFATDSPDPLRHAAIINASWGGGNRSQALQDAIANCNCLFVAAAGNDATSRVQYPAGYNLGNIVSVAATDSNDALASFSNYSSSWVDLGAPGVDILSTYRGNTYNTLSGTSMAAPHVSGTAALLLANSPGLSAADLKSAIMGSGDLVASLQGKTVSGRRLNAARALGSPAMPPDDSPPDAVSNLTTINPTQNSVTLTWTASGDDGPSGQAYLYDLRYSTSPITAINFASATPATGEPLPQLAGILETYTLTNLDAGTTYNFALRVVDEVGQSALSQTLVAKTLTGPRWVVEVIQDPLGKGGFYHALDFDGSGNPAVAYGITVKRTDTVRFARKTNPSVWQFSTADQGSPGIDLVLDHLGNPSISHGWGKLRFVQSSNGGSSWLTPQILDSNANNDLTSLKFDSARNPAIAYAAGGGVKLARRNDNSWSREVVDAGGARYQSLAFDKNGYPAIAYSADKDGDGWLDTLKFARWNGSSWDIEVVETGVIGNGVFASLAFDSLGNPTIAHAPSGNVSFLRWTGKTATGWEKAEPVAAGSDCSLAYDGNDTATISYAADQQLKWASRKTDGTWVSEIADRSTSIVWITSLKFDPAGNPAVLYHDYTTNMLRLARREPGPN